MDCQPQRLRLSRRPGFRLQAHSVAINGLPAMNCSRPGRFGNPFTVGEQLGDLAVPRNRAECVVMFRAAFEHVQAGGILCPARLHDRIVGIVACLPALRGANTACWCPLPEDGEPDVCHAAMLLEIANETRA